MAGTGKFSEYSTPSARTPSPSKMGKNLDSEKMQKIQHYQ